MTTNAELTEKVAALYLSAVNSIEEFTRALADSVIETVSNLPALPAFAGAEALPTHLEIVTGYYSFLEDRIHAQKDFAVRLASAAATSPKKPSRTAKG
jgi:hypothetical protein